MIVDFANCYAQNITRRLKAKPIRPITKKRGEIHLCKLTSDNIVTPAVNAILDKKPTGSVCVITRTNDEALNIVGQLLQNGINARQIQTNAGFNLYNLAELRYFIDCIGAGVKAVGYGAGGVSSNNTYDDGVVYNNVYDVAYTVNDEAWQRAKDKLSDKYRDSEDLPYALELIKDFEAIHNYTKYKSDFRQYVLESKLEELIAKKDGTILVSTIHQTKGREFDEVYLALSGFPKMDDEARRAVYVALTRAKRRLYILSACNYFDNIDVNGIVKTIDANEYPPLDRICLQLTHKDVALGYFAYRGQAIDRLVSGQPLSIGEDGCYFGDKLVVKYSSNFNIKIDELSAKGYAPVKAAVRHIVYWYDKDKDRESKIILPVIEFSK
jgi:ATP-dependent DNA helicase RecQ